MNTKAMTFRQLLERFPDDKACKAFLAEKRWPNGEVTCPRCGSKAYTLKARPFHYLCKSGKESTDPNGSKVTCDKKNGYRFSILTRTVFENTNYPLREWFKVIFLMFHSKKGMSAHQIHQMLGTGSYQTAWFMCHRIRSAMRGDVLPLEGEVEVDETFMGGKNYKRHWDKRVKGTGGFTGKVPVIGAIARKGNVVCKAIENTDIPTLDRFVRKAVSQGVKLIATDEHSGYRLLGAGAHPLPHQVIRHGAGEYVVGSTHTNSIESFWSLLKRGIMGSYHKVSRDYLPLYLNEFSYRFNNRENPTIFDDIVAGC